MSVDERRRWGMRWLLRRDCRMIAEAWTDGTELIIRLCGRRRFHRGECRWQ